MAPSSTSKLILAMVAIAAHCGACVMAWGGVFVGIHVGPNFRVKALDRGHPVEGLHLKIGLQSAVTDKNGFALFRDVPLGQYYGIVADPDNAGPWGDPQIEVDADGAADATVPLDWPSVRPILVRSVKGVIRGPNYFTAQSQPKLRLDLLEASSGRTLKSAQTDEKGQFDFEASTPGLYFVHLKSGQPYWPREATGLITVAIDPAAPAESLDLDVNSSDCGMSYIDSSRCSPAALHVGQLSGRVADASGAGVPSAKILLFDSANELVEQIQSDRAGKFVSSYSVPGAYQLVVSSPGFTLLHRSIHIEPGGDSKALTVELSIGGCSAANLQ